MSALLLTKYTGKILGPIAWVLGYIMEAIFWVLDKIGIPNVGLAIILFTIVIYILLLPLTIKQQKFSKLQAKMNPELQVINAKYKGKKDQDSMQAMQDETKAVYAKYGVSPTGSCLQLLIQMPILFALYRVIGNIPAYVSQVKAEFMPLVDKLMTIGGSSEFLQKFKNANLFSKQFTDELFVNGDKTFIQNTFIDVLNKASSAEWETLKTAFDGTLEPTVTSVMAKLNEYNNFLFINIAEAPWDVMKNAWSEKEVLIMLSALIIPALAGLSQWVSLKLTPQPNADAQAQSKDENPMASSMKTMNNVMPLMSVFFCFTLPAGMGLYWIAGSVVRCIQQVCINKYIDKMDIDSLIVKNTEKYNEKLKKQGVLTQGINNSAKMNTKRVETKKPVYSQEDRNASVKKSTEYYNKDATKGSIAAKAGMVRQYNEKNNKENK